MNLRMGTTEWNYYTHIVKVTAKRAVRLHQIVETLHARLMSGGLNRLHVRQTVFAAHRIRICGNVDVAAAAHTSEYVAVGANAEALVKVAEMIDVAAQQTGGQFGTSIVHWKWDKWL